MDKAKDYLNVSKSFSVTLLKRVPEIVDGDPVKVAFNLAKLILDLKEVSRPVVL